MAGFSAFATTEGTRRYAQRFPQAGADHFRQRYGLWMSSMGLGTYLGAPTDAVSQGYVESMVSALAAGCNVIDTAPTYRHLRSERAVGVALAQAFDRGVAQRDEVIICTKGGYVPYDWPADAHPGELASGVHSLDVAFLSAQIRASLTRLGLDALDVYYLHEPEIHLNQLNPGEFLQRLHGAFVGLENEVQAGRIRFYGVTSGLGLLANADDERYLPLYKMVQVAEAVAGPNHHFRFLQFPCHLGMMGALTTHNQTVKRKVADRMERMHMALLAAAVQHGLTAMTCTSLAQGQWAEAEEMPKELVAAWAAELNTALGHPVGKAQLALHFARSTPGVTTALVGMSSPAHVVENLALVPVPPVDPDRFFELFG